MRSSTLLSLACCAIIGLNNTHVHDLPPKFQTVNLMATSTVTTVNITIITVCRYFTCYIASAQNCTVSVAFGSVDLSENL